MFLKYDIIFTYYYMCCGRECKERASFGICSFIKAEANPNPTQTSRAPLTNTVIQRFTLCEVNFSNPTSVVAIILVVIVIIISTL
jgi:hypothetical protein